MPSARSSRSSAAERTPCPHCGRDTPTASDGVCVECWGRKRAGPRLFASSRRERGYFWEDLDDLFWSTDALWLVAAAVALVGGILVLVVR